MMNDDKWRDCSVELGCYFTIDYLQSIIEKLPQYATLNGNISMKQDLMYGNTKPYMILQWKEKIL